MEIAKEWALENPRPSFVFIALMLTSPIEKILLPYLSSQIIKNVNDRNELVFSILKWVVVYIICFICNYIFEMTRFSIVTELNNKSVQSLFNRILDSDWSVSDNDVFELMSIIQSSSSYSWKIIDIVYSILGGQIFTLIATVYVFSQNATLYVTIILILSIFIGMKSAQSATEDCKDSVEQYNISKAETLSNIADMISSRAIIDKSKDKDTYIKPTLLSLKDQHNKEHDCRKTITKKLSVTAAISTTIIYVFLFIDLIQKNISIENFTILFFVAKEVFDIPTSLEHIFYDNMQIDVFESSLNERLQKKKPNQVIENKDIKIKNVKIRYLPIDQPRVYMKVQQGSIVSLTGPNGCGKSSLLRIIAGIEAPLNDDGVIMAPLDSMYVPQNANLTNKSIIENIGLGLSRNPTEKEVVKMLNDNHLKSYVSVFKKYLSEPVGELGKKLSGGQRQIVWMLRLIFSNKKTAMLDEPTSWMSSRVSEAYLNCLRRNKITALIVTHDRNVQSFADVNLEWDEIVVL